MHALTKGSKEWKQAVADSKMAMANGGKFQVKVKSSSDAKFFLKESQGNMNRYKAHTQSARADGVAKYPKGYEQHMAPEGGFGDTPHIKWYKMEGMVIFFMTSQTKMKNSYRFEKLIKSELGPTESREDI